MRVFLGSHGDNFLNLFFRSDPKGFSFIHTTKSTLVVTAANSDLENQTGCLTRGTENSTFINHCSSSSIYFHISNLDVGDENPANQPLDGGNKQEYNLSMD